MLQMVSQASYRTEYSDGLAKTLIEFRSESKNIQPVIAIIEEKSRVEAE
jgi:hypothetical protein